MSSVVTPGFNPEDEDELMKKRSSKNEMKTKMDKC
jgi:hypothetical protein